MKSHFVEMPLQIPIYFILVFDHLKWSRLDCIIVDYLTKHYNTITFISSFLISSELFL